MEFINTLEYIVSCLGSVCWILVDIFIIYTMIKLIKWIRFSNKEIRKGKR